MPSSWQARYLLRCWRCSQTFFSVCWNAACGSRNEVHEMKRFVCAILLFVTLNSNACHSSSRPQLVITSKFFTEQVVLAELLAQHIEARTGIQVQRRANLGGTLLVEKAMLSGDVDLYVEYTGTALTAILGEHPQGDSKAVYRRVKEEYARRFGFEV